MFLQLHATAPPRRFGYMTNARSRDFWRGYALEERRVRNCADPEYALISFARNHKYHTANARVEYAPRCSICLLSRAECEALTPTEEETYA